MEVGVEKTVVVNKNYKDFDVYIGRGSKFGNPYYIGKDGDRNQVIDLYRDWFLMMLKDPIFKRDVLALKGKRLGCFCKPLACHGDVIVEYLENIPDSSDEIRLEIILVAVELFKESNPIEGDSEKYTVSAKNLRRLGALLSKI